MTFVFDCDSTLIDCESLEELAAIALKNLPDREERLNQIEEITNRGMTGELPFNESLARRLKLFSATRGQVDELAQNLLSRITPSVLEIKDWIDENRDSIYVVSGGFEDYLFPVLEKIGIKKEHIFANKFVYDGDKVTGFDDSRYLSRPLGKVNTIAELELPRPIVIIGDGSTDAEVRECGEADEFWAVTEILDRPSVTAKTDRNIDSLSKLPELAAEFSAGSSARV